MARARARAQACERQIKRASFSAPLLCFIAAAAAAAATIAAAANLKSLVNRVRVRVDDC